MLRWAETTWKAHHLQPGLRAECVMLHVDIFRLVSGPSLRLLGLQPTNRKRDHCWVGLLSDALQAGRVGNYSTAEIR